MQSQWLCKFFHSTSFRNFWKLQVSKLRNLCIIFSTFYFKNFWCTYTQALKTSNLHKNHGHPSLLLFYHNLRTVCIYQGCGSGSVCCGWIRSDFQNKGSYPDLIFKIWCDPDPVWTSSKFSCSIFFYQSYNTIPTYQLYWLLCTE